MSEDERIWQGCTHILRVYMLIRSILSFRKERNSMTIKIQRK